MPLNIKKSSLQRIFEFALKHVRKQGRPAMTGSGCGYRDHQDDGTVLMCAVGAMLTDEQIATFGIENDAGVNEESAGAFRAYIGNERKVNLLRSVQRAHDNAAWSGEIAAPSGVVSYGPFLTGFEVRMKSVALEFGLKYAPPGVTLRT